MLILFFWLNSVFFISMLDGFHIYSHCNKKHSHWRVPISDRAGGQYRLFEQCITTSETWINCYNPVFKQQTSECVLRGFSLPLKPCARKSKMKYMVITFFDQEVHTHTHTHTTMPDGQTVNVDWYVKILKQLTTVHISHKRPHHCNGKWKLHHDNVRPM